MDSVSTESVAPVPRQDLDELLHATAPAVWQGLRGQTMLLTGGTGFVGKWLLESLLHAHRNLGLDLKLIVLTRDPERFARGSSHLAHAPPIELVRGDVTDFKLPGRRFSLAIHAALPVAGPSVADDGALARLAEAGANNVCTVAAASGARRLLHVSSGAVYGPAPAGLPLPETAVWTEQPPNAYTLAKRLAEAAVQQHWPFEVVVARCFAFIGPCLMPASGSAAAQFIDSAARRHDIVVQGTGEAVRSYQYAADMARWLLTCLVLGKPNEAYNVGDDSGITIADLARQVAQASTPAVDVRIEGRAAPGLAGSHYLPEVQLAARTLGLRNTVDLSDAIRRTLAWQLAQRMLHSA